MTSAYLDCVDAEAPGLVEGLHLTGSVAMGDFQPGGPLTRWGPSGASSSDIDFFAVVSETAKPSIVAALARAHEQLRRRHRRPFFDGLYVTEEELAADSSQLNRVPQTHEGKLSWEETEPPSPVVWHELADHAVTLRGPAISAGAVWTNREVLVAWCRTNLENYWLRWLQHSRRFPDPWAFMALAPPPAADPCTSTPTPAAETPWSSSRPSYSATALRPRLVPRIRSLVDAGRRKMLVHIAQIIFKQRDPRGGAGPDQHRPIGPPARAYLNRRAPALPLS